MSIKFLSLWADVPEQTIEAGRRLSTLGLQCDAFGHINYAATPSRHYAGHSADGGGVQQHSCGADYPYVIGQRETGLEDGTVYHYVVGGRAGSTPNILFSTLERARQFVGFLKASDILDAQDASDRRAGKHIAAAIQLAAVRALGH